MSAVKRGQRTIEEMAALRALIIKRAKADPELSPVMLSTRLQCSTATVRETLREAGLIPETGRYRDGR